jgi:ribosomal protein L1
VEDLSIPLRPPRRAGLCVFARKKNKARKAAKAYLQQVGVLHIKEIRDKKLEQVLLGKKASY